MNKFLQAMLIVIQTVWLHCGTDHQNYCLVSVIMVQPLTSGVQGASWLRCGLAVRSCRVIQSNTSFNSSHNFVAL